MGERLLFTADVARLAEVAPRTITMYLHSSRRKQEAGAALTLADLPIPRDEDQARSPSGPPRLVPRWRKSQVDRWLKHRQVGGGPRRKAAS